MIHLHKLLVTVFYYRDGETPFLIMYNEFDTDLCTMDDACNILLFLDFIGWTEEDIKGAVRL